MIPFGKKFHVDGLQWHSTESV